MPDQLTSALLIVAAFAYPGGAVLLIVALGQGDSPEEIVRRRFAAGEIDEGEYFRLRADLRQ